MSATRVLPRLPIEASILVAASVLLLVIGSVAVPAFLSAGYLLQQMQIASFLGVVALGALGVIMIGHIDLSVPWAMTASAICATAVASLTSGMPGGAIVSLMAGLALGALIGLINGAGVAILRVPSMIWTLGINAVILGLCVLITGGFAPSGTANALIRQLAVGNTVGVPNATLLWIVGMVATALILRWTVFGRALIALGHGERAEFLSGVPTGAVTIGTFVFAGIASAFGGLLLAGYAGQAYQSMGDPYLLPAIAAIVLSGARLQGGVGSPLPVAIAVLFLSLMSSVLSVFQISAGARQIVYGSVILITLVVYGRIRGVTAR